MAIAIIGIVIICLIVASLVNQTKNPIEENDFENLPVSEYTLESPTTTTPRETDIDGLSADADSKGQVSRSIRLASRETTLRLLRTFGDFGDTTDDSEVYVRNVTVDSDLPEKITAGLFTLLYETDDYTYLTKHCFFGKPCSFMGLYRIHVQTSVFEELEIGQYYDEANSGSTLLPGQQKVVSVWPVEELLLLDMITDEFISLHTHPTDSKLYYCPDLGCKLDIRIINQNEFEVKVYHAGQSTTTGGYDFSYERYRI